jgi:hypothetical protein
LAALLLAVALLGCEPEDVYVAFVPDGGGGPMRGPPCTDNTDCPPQDFCERRTCGDAAGRCVHRPQLCEPVSAPMCGCELVDVHLDVARREEQASGEDDDAHGRHGSGVTASASALTAAASSAAGRAR